MDGKNGNNQKSRESTRLGPEFSSAFQQLASILRRDIARQPADKEAALAEILDHLIEAEVRGHSVEDVFGFDIDAYGQEVLESIPVKPIRRYANPILSSVTLAATGATAAALIADKWLSRHSYSDVLSWNAKTSVISILFAIVFAVFPITTRWQFFASRRNGDLFLAALQFGGGALAVFCAYSLAPGKVLPPRETLIVVGGIVGIAALIGNGALEPLIRRLH